MLNHIHKIKPWAAALLLLSTCQSMAQTASTPVIQPEPGDQIVFLGNAFFEQAVEYAELETSLALRWPNKQLKFRNIGWSGDTVFGHSRTHGRRGAKFGTPEEGFNRMIQQLQSLKPEILIIAYGYNESAAGSAGLPAFRMGMQRLLETIEAMDAQVILLSPTPMEKGFGADDSYVAQRNAEIERYAAAIQSIATERDLAYVDLFHPLQKSRSPYSKDGIHPSAAGYRQIALIMGESLQLPKTKISLSANSADIIRSAIIAKNQLFFHRWRPRNNAFVFGERKDEQRIAQLEPARIEPYIAEQEERINTLLENLL